MYGSKFPYRKKRKNKDARPGCKQLTGRRPDYRPTGSLRWQQTRRPGQAGAFQIGGTRRKPLFLSNRSLCKTGSSPEGMQKRGCRLFSANRFLTPFLLYQEIGLYLLLHQLSTKRESSFANWEKIYHSFFEICGYGFCEYR